MFEIFITKKLTIEDLGLIKGGIEEKNKNNEGKKVFPQH